VAEVRAAAHRQLETVGPAGLSLREVAREVGMAVSALYRYYANRDALLTDLLVRAFDSHADAVEVATAEVPDDPMGAVRAAFLAYRAWGMQHPADFGLAYGTPVPGYTAPAEQTVRAGTRIPDHLIGLATAAWERGQLDRAAVRERGDRLSPGTAAQLAALCAARDYTLPVAAYALAHDCYAAVHGLVAMEVFGQLRPVLPDAEHYLQEVLDAHLQAMSAAQVAPGRRRGAARR
jgi:AcrR family transcriptional regulator